MKEQEYLDLISDIRNKIYEDKIEEAETELLELYKYKPVRLLWFVARAELRWKQGKCSEVFPELVNKKMDIYDYPGIEEYADLVENWMKVKSDEIRRINNHAVYSKVIGTDKYPYDTEYLNEAYEKCFDNDTYENMYELMEAFRKNNDMVSQQIIRYYLIKEGYLEKDKDGYYNKIENFDYLEEKVLCSSETFIILQNENNKKECDVLISVLNKLGHQVFLLTEPTTADNISVEVSIEQGIVLEEATLVPVLKNAEGKSNLSELIYCICKFYIMNKYAILIAGGREFELLMKSPNIQKHIECLQNMDYINFPRTMYFGWVGDYIKYISDVYDLDVKQRLDEESVCDFSIVIPTRNSAGTLYYTLQTCLNQDYEGSYEIIVSDNSTNGKMEVYQVCKDLNDHRIKYVKTPRDLQLTKSFEFAFLQAKGEFIFSVGSDDGVCPWALSAMKKILDEHPDDDVLQWKRGYYAWSDFGEREANKLVIPGQFSENELSCFNKERLQYFAEILKNTSNAYSLPTMYINSGFRRKYFHKLLNKTGRLWDGCNQDLYMGVISSAINDSVLNVDFPLTVAGMSKNSLGYIVGKESNRDSLSEEERKIRASTHVGDNVGIYILNGIVKEIPIGRGESFSLYANLFRAIQLGVLPVEWKNNLFDYKKIYTEFFKEHTILDDEFDKYVHYARYQAGLRGKEFLEWFDKTIYEPSMQPRYYEPKQNNVSTDERSYKVGITEAGGLILDASEYGVTNIADAVKLFERFVYWTPESWKNM